MKSLLNYEMNSILRRWWFYVLLLGTIGFGFVVGSGATMNFGPAVFKNGTYGVSLMVSFLSLFSIMSASLLGSLIFFRETDHQFHLIYYALPKSKFNFTFSKFLTALILSIVFALLLVAGFTAGHTSKIGQTNYTDFNILNYLFSFLVFSLLNTIFCVSYITFIAQLSKSKMMVYVAGILLYIFYMAMLIFSGSPLMTKGMPPSEFSVFVTTLIDPFGMSGFFHQTSKWTLAQRNFEYIIPQGLFLMNRIMYIVLSTIFVWFSVSNLDIFQSGKKSNFSLNIFSSNKTKTTEKPHFINNLIKFVEPSTSRIRHLKSLASITKIDLIYCIKSIPFIMFCLGFSFYMSMEIYGAIEKGVRLPQHYASSGLLSSTIISEFNILALLAIMFYTNDIYWRSKASNFYLIESSTWTDKLVIFCSKYLTIIVLILIFTLIIVVLAIVFQFAYGYTNFDLPAYFGLIVFLVFRLIAITGLLLLIQLLMPNKISSLIASVVAVGILTTSLGNRILDHPLFECFMPFAGKYSDMNRYGPYLKYFTFRYGFAFFWVLALITLVFMFKRRSKSSQVNLSFNTISGSLLLIAFVAISTLLGFKTSEDYIKKDKEGDISKAVDYEKRYRHFQTLNQPTVTSILTKVDLYPKENKYRIKGKYILKNKTSSPIDSFLLNLPDDFSFIEARFKNQIITSSSSVLKTTIQAGDSIELTFDLMYQWHGVNGHQSFNAIIENGTFMRISRYYPSIGYIASKETEDETIRKERALDKATQIVKWNAPKSSLDDFILLDMTISTDEDQVALGVGELVSQHKENKRSIFRYKTTSPIPFRFGISSAKYQIKKDIYRGKTIEVYYHPTHHENVSHLIENIKHTLEYCETNFGPYPFSVVRFAEISGFTKGFAATAYPATIYMKEDMIFHANIHADKKQDVINELAGHELSHIWWGNNQIAPANREGEALLTETLAMYTELMLVKKMHGEDRMLTVVNLNKRMYLEERGFTNEQPLVSVHSENGHLSYYKGLVVMYQMMQKFGEPTINKALKSFLEKHGYPNARPISTDLINEFYAIIDKKDHAFIDELFKEMVIYSFEIKKEEYKDKTFYLEASVIKKTKREDQTEVDTPFNGIVEVAFYFEKNDKPYIVKHQSVNGRITLNLAFDKKPSKVVIDPNVRYL